MRGGNEIKKIMQKQTTREKEREDGLLGQIKKKSHI